jgi:hypothetical protein
MPQVYSKPKDIPHGVHKGEYDWTDYDPDSCDGSMVEITCEHCGCRIFLEPFYSAEVDEEICNCNPPRLFTAQLIIQVLEPVDLIPAQE